MTDYYTCPECNGHRRYCGCKEKAKAKEMTDKQTPPDWVLIEAAKRSGCDVLVAEYIRYNIFEDSHPFRALCDMIERYEQPPVDRKLLCAREAMAQACALPESEGAYRRGTWDHAGALKQCLRAIELWEEGFGK